MVDETCVFCEIVQREEKAHIVWENEDHIAFLSIYPNTEGTTVVIPKKHLDSYAFEVSEQEMLDLCSAARRVGKKIDSAFDNVGRTAMVLEGFGVDHLHAKLFPLHGTKLDEWESIESDRTEYYDKYQGFVSSHDSDRRSDSELEKVAEKIRNERI